KNTIDPNLKNDRTSEVIVGLDREIGAGFAVGGNYIWRKYDNFSWSPTNGIATDGSSYTAVSFTPPSSACPSGASCPTLIYYQLPMDFNVSAFYNTRQGYPFERTITSPTRANGAGTASLLLDNVGDSRLPNFQNLDLRVERPVRIGTMRFVPALDLFNAFNKNTEQAIRGAQNSSNANFIQANVAPRVLRFGIRVNW